MRVAVDATYSLGRSLSGVGIYCRRIIESLAAAAPDWQFLLCYRSNRFFRAIREPRLAVNTRRRLLEEPLNWWLPARVGLYHGLNQRLPHYRFRRAVSTFHDLFALSGDFSTANFQSRFAALARDAASRSDHIIAVSAYTAKQIECRLGIEPGRITVVHHGVEPIPEFSADDLAAFRRRYQVERPILLHVGALQARKNILRLIDAFESLALDVDLVLAGSDGYQAEKIHARIGESHARRQIHAMGYLPQADIERLYRSAAVLAFPSLEEGFGFPVIEAMSADLPVVTSNGSALREIAGGAALLTDPADTSALAQAIERALTDTALRNELISKGRSRAAQFTWKTAAEKTLAVYRKLIA